ncbi:hypothetical protein H112_05797 [Trichophyton rubrum D6]|uniref:Uncharacterized protein n=2 Tax=Trichophyton TaxID=5550 RepID=A0A022VYH2_TRIRU|nr:hypothetical protein H100_05814 [Trichophyton rubrum MR850]EZF40231.1 hypothetical protein H102_05783 [Trichophyton rubrum CBS 100081]EZF51004.1 hypothetical protein H103_05809 [Trichophyton rubrum CBS 288.86]EZF61428.1 hypothetical protein H104_05794 [Trichophyton rubrum CBS 289.86]EZF72109.1 hypothetical protein H105_05823 [Trichophyton soudanense CBS 452.61]EZF82751.1 hypothetical protein H110_05802 [Trichophyton rubrum MR1448]EZF93692.1 hypothetical protein H113_05851 [Trichophyton rub
MSGKAGLLPVALAVGLGIFNGYMVFKPAYQERETQKTLGTLPKETEPTYTRQIYNWWTGNSTTDKTGQQK